MKKVLILSYYFPPCELTASQRVYSWANYLKKFGYYPIVVTRKWEHPIKTYIDCSYPTSDGEVHEVFDTHEVYRLPYLGNTRDKLYAKYGANRYTILRRLLTFKELLLQNIIDNEIPYINLYKKARRIIKDENIHVLLISGNLFTQFKFGYKLNKEFGIPWLADYRDAWTTSEINALERSPIFKIIDGWDQIFEKKWVATASKVTASSKPIGDSITTLTGTPSVPLYNGFVEDDFKPYQNEPKSSQFLITYVGTLYEGQDISIFLTAFKHFVDKNLGVNALVLFPGLKMKKAQCERVQKLMKGYEKYLKVTDRVPKSEILKIQKQSHLLLHVAWKGFKGIVASKIYEYLASGSEVLVTPSDNGAVAEIIEQAQRGVLTNTVEETVSVLERHYQQYQNEESREVTSLELPTSILQFSREFQVKKLAQILDDI